MQRLENDSSDDRFRLAHMASRQSPLGGFDNLSLAWCLLILGSFSFGEANTSVAMSGQLSIGNIVRYACIVIALAAMVPELRSPIRVSLNALWLFAVYAVVCVLSTLWSVSPFVTLGKAAELSIATATVLMASNRNDGGRAVAQLFMVTFAVGVTALTVAVAGYLLDAPGFSQRSNGLISRQLGTWFLHSNSVGYVSALTATVALDVALRQPRRRVLMLGLYVFAIMTAILAQGRTGLFSFCVGTLLVLAMHRKYRILLAVSVLLLSAGLLFGKTIESYLVRGDVTENLQTLSGRTALWNIGWESFSARPLLGLGFGVAGRALLKDAGLGNDNSSLHSGLFELLVSVGLVGFIPWIASLTWTLRDAFRSGIAGKNVAACAILLPLLATTVMSTGAGGWFSIPLAYFLCSTGILAIGASKRRQGAIRQGPSRGGD